MPKDIVPNQNPVSLPRLPVWLTSILDVPAHPDVGWEPPKWLPAESDLRQALADCERLVAGRVHHDFAKQCYIRMMANFEANTKLTADETRLRLAVWLDATGDLSDALWKHATDCSIRTLKWMPKVAEFRVFADEEVHRAKHRIVRLKKMLSTRQKPAEKTYEREPRDVRLKTLRDSLRAIGKTNRAAGYERQLAEREGRAPAAWALEVSTEIETKPERPPFKPGSSPSDKRCAELAAEFHKARTEA